MLTSSKLMVLAISRVFSLGSLSNVTLILTITFF